MRTISDVRILILRNEVNSEQVGVYANEQGISWVEAKKRLRNETPPVFQMRINGADWVNVPIIYKENPCE